MQHTEPGKLFWRTFYPFQLQTYSNRQKYELLHLCANSSKRFYEVLQKVLDAGEESNDPLRW